MKTICTLFFLSLLKFTFAQTLSLDTGETYAVVVGISDYQDPQIPDLRFADKDALAFANFLRSPAGGSLDEDHLKVLINEEATVAQFAIALDWLMEVVKENDKVLLYFSGHGDVERKTITQPGYLLCWDAPSRVYLSGGALALPMFQDIISTLSAQNKAKVVVITDACRSGKLSGSSIGGAQITGANLAKVTANEIKILSCQADEYSIEGEQWGGGRGAFSYHLLDGLYGMADGNADMNVSLKELGRYLEDNVTEQVAPEKQNPVILGDKSEKLTDVFPDILNELKEGRRGQMQLFKPTETRGIEEDVLASVDPITQKIYSAFKRALKEKQFLEPVDACADAYYEILIKEPKMEKLHSSMRRSYAAALQDDAQQVLNRLLKSTPVEVNKTQYAKDRNYALYPELIRRAADLLGEEHYMYNRLMARSYWFEGYIKDGSTCYCVNPQNAKTVIPYYKKALEYQPEMPHAFYQLGVVYGLQMGEKDSMEYYLNLALETVPGWLAVYYWGGYTYITYMNNKRYTQLSIEADSLYKSRAEYWLKRGLTVDSNSVLLLSELGNFYRGLMDYEAAEKALTRALSIDTVPQTLHDLSSLYLSWRKYEKMIFPTERLIVMDSSYLTNTILADLYFYNNQDEKAKKWMQDLIDMDLKKPGIYSEIGRYNAHAYPKESLEMLNKSLELGSEHIADYIYASSQQGYFPPIDTAKELRILRQAVELYPDESYLHALIGLCFLRKNAFDQAKSNFHYSLSLYSSNALSHWGLYLLYLQNGMIKEAENALKKWMELSANNFMFELPWVTYLYLQDRETVEQYFKKIEALYPDNAMVHFYLAIHYCYYKKNNEAALEELEKAFQKGFKNYFLLRNEWRFRSLWNEEEERWEALIQEYFPEEN